MVFRFIILMFGSVLGRYQTVTAGFVLEHPALLSDTFFETLSLNDFSPLSQFAKYLITGWLCLYIIDTMSHEGSILNRYSAGQDTAIQRIIETFQPIKHTQLLDGFDFNRMIIMRPRVSGHATKH